MNRIQTAYDTPPTIRDTGITVAEILQHLATGETEEQILAAIPGLEHDDFLAVYEFAAASVVAGSSMSETFSRIRRDISDKLNEVMKDRHTTKQ